MSQPSNDHLSPARDIQKLLAEARALGTDRLPEALDCLDSALHQAEAAEATDLIDSILLHRAQVHSMLMRSPKALADAERALNGFTQRQEQRSQAAALNIIAIVKKDLGQYAESYLVHHEALTIARELNAHDAIAHLANNVGLTCSYLGDYETAIAYYGESLQAWEKAGPDLGKGHVHLNLGLTYSALEDPDEADIHFHGAQAIYRDHGDHYAVNVLCNLTATALQRADLTAADTYSASALQNSASQDDPARKAHALDCRGTVLFALGDCAAAREAHRQALEIYESISMPRGRASALRHLARLERDDPDAATRRFLEAKAIAEEAQLTPMVIEILGELYRHERDHGFWREACHYLEEKVSLEKARIAERATMKVKALRLDLQLEQSRREADLERARSSQLSQALETLEITKQKAEEENRQKSEILNFAAHDLRNLLWGVLGPAELLLQDYSNPEEFLNAMEMIDAMVQSARLLDETLGHILDAAAIEAGKIALKKEKVELRALAENALYRWLPRAQAKNQRLVLLPGRDSLVANLDRIRFIECMGNLISNAIKYSPPGSALSIAWEEQGDFVCFAVRDQGPGLTTADRKRMGKMFQRLSAKPTGNEISIGVGLAMVKRVTELHGGHLDVESPDSGGSLFRIHLPASAIEFDEEAGEAPPIPGEPGIAQ